MPVSGDFAALRSLRGRLSEESIRGILPKAAQRMSATSLKLLADEFRAGRDPYGRPWAPTKRGNPPLRWTGRMAGSPTGQADGPNVKVTIGVNYAIYAQDGTKRHERKGGAIPQSRHGRFQSKKKASQARARSQRVAIFGDYTHGGSPRRQMLPQAETGGLGPTWYAAFIRDEREAVTKALGGR